MNGINFIDGGVCAPLGFSANGIHSGIRKNKDKLDLALIVSDEICDSAAVYTQNLVCGAPITVTRDNIKNGKAKAIICNSGIANTCAADGVEKAESMCKLVSVSLDVDAGDVIVASTGVIGPTIELEPIENGMEELVNGLSNEGSDLAARAIMTTDTRKKEFAVAFKLQDKLCKIGAISKGSGMIHPNMATLLCFVTTDVNINSQMLQKALDKVVADTFNMLSIDGDTSTNDMLSIMANGFAENERIETENEDFVTFVSALNELLITVVREMARDGEGASKLLECKVYGAKDNKTAKAVAKSVICSSLVKTAMFGSDANWGRILCAIGYSGVQVDVTKTDVSFFSKKGKIDVCKNGAGIDFSEDLAKKILLEDEITIFITFHEGEGVATAFGCDLTHDYVSINGDYRT